MPESVVTVIEDVIEKYEIISHSKTKTFIKKKLFGCRICEKRFKTKGSLKNHKSLYHNNLKMELSCPLPDCESSFTLKCNLLKHISAVHEKKRQYCHICADHFAYTQDLHKHIARVHRSLPLESVKKSIKISASSGQTKRSKRKKCSYCTSKSKQNENPYKKQYKSLRKRDMDEILTFDELDHTIKKEANKTADEKLETDADKKAEEKCTCANAGLNQDEKMIPYECSKCDASFETLSEIDKHFASVHHEENRDPLELNEELQQSKSPEKKVENSKDQKIFFIPIKKN